MIGGDGGGGSTIDAEADSLILSEGEVSATLSGEYSQESSRPPEMEPVGFESSAIRSYQSQSGDVAELGVVVFDSVSNAESYYDDEYQEAFDTEDVGSEAFSSESGGTTFLIVRERNVAIQVIGSLHISNFRSLAEEQINQLDE